MYISAPPLINEIETAVSVGKPARRVVTERVGTLEIEPGHLAVRL
jgi:hypothetical protein